MHERIGQPVLILLRRPAALAHQHSVHVSAGELPENIARSGVVKFRPKPACVAQGSDHPFLSLIAQAFALAFQSCQFGRNHARTSQQIEGCALRIVNLSGDRGREPQPGFRIPRAQCA